MKTLTVVGNGKGTDERFVIPYTAGKSLRRILNTSEHPVRTGCPGNGSCGLCLVRIVEGDAMPPGENERLQLGKQQLASGMRLACQVICETDLSVEIINRRPMSVWRSIPEAFYRHAFEAAYPLHDVPPLPDGKNRRACGVAVDLGTTSISLSLFDLVSGRLLTTRYGINPQTKDGLDVLTRVSAAAESRQEGARMQKELISAIRDALLDMAVGEGFDLRRICRVVLVGNTAMLTLLAGVNRHYLLDPEYWTRHIRVKLPETSSWAEAWRIHPRAGIEVIPPLAGFVGSDLAAGIMAIELTDEPGNLLVDFGTNSEIALWDGKTLWVTSVAGGPAFEGSGISCGIPAEKGAIYHFDLRKQDYAVFGGTHARGICGSGLVDLVADLVDLDLLNPVGQFTESPKRQDFEIIEGISLSKKDVDLLQRAKAAVAAGIQVLLQQAEISYGDLRRVYIAGAFGHHLNTRNALRIGLLPPTTSEIYRFCGNSALAGCGKILLQADAEQKLTEIGQQYKIVNLAESQAFDELFFQNLFIEPMK